MFAPTEAAQKLLRQRGSTVIGMLCPQWVGFFSFSSRSRSSSHLETLSLTVQDAASEPLDGTASSRTKGACAQGVRRHSVSR